MSGENKAARARETKGELRDLENRFLSTLWHCPNFAAHIHERGKAVMLFADNHLVQICLANVVERLASIKSSSPLSPSI